MLLKIIAHRPIITTSRPDVTLLGLQAAIETTLKKQSETDEKALIDMFLNLRAQNQIHDSLFVFLVPPYVAALRNDEDPRVEYLKGLVDRHSWVYTSKAFLLVDRVLAKSISPDANFDLSFYSTLSAAIVKRLTREVQHLNGFHVSTKTVSPATSNLFPILTQYLDSKSPSDQNVLRERLEKETIYRGSLLELVEGDMARFLASEYDSLKPHIVEAYLNSGRTEHLGAIIMARGIDDRLKARAFVKLSRLPNWSASFSTPEMLRQIRIVVNKAILPSNEWNILRARSDIYSIFSNRGFWNAFSNKVTAWFALESVMFDAAIQLCANHARVTNLLQEWNYLEPDLNSLVNQGYRGRQLPDLVSMARFG